VEGRPPEDAALAERAKRGDARAFEELVRMYQDIAFRTAFLFTRSAADADDAAQDGFVKAWAALPRFRSGAPFKPWLLRIVANEARNRRRSAGRRAELVLRAAAAQPPGDAAPSPEGAALERDQRRELLERVTALAERDREIIACRYFLELSERETAEVLAVREGTVKSRTARALARLQAEVER
jgi:RNA polymerase sigma-70 factor (ECF subfamily)